MADSPFEIPQQIRDLAEQNVRQARATYGQFIDTMNQAMGAWFGAMPANAMTQGFQSVRERAAQYAKRNAEAAFALADDIAKAKNVQEILALQSRFAMDQMQTYASQTQELGKLIAEAAQKAGRG